MAEERYIKIRIGSEADAKGFDEAERRIDRVKAKQVGGGDNGDFTAHQMASDAEAGEQALRRNALAAQAAEVARTRMQLTQAATAGEAALVAQLRLELAVRQATLGMMRQHSFTQGELNKLHQIEASSLDAIGARTAAADVNMRQLRSSARQFGQALISGKVGADDIAGILGSLGTSMSVAAIAGFGLHEVIAHAADESTRLAEEIGEQTTKLVEQVKVWNELSSSAQNYSDVVQLGQKIQPELEQLSKKLEDFRAREVSAWGKFMDLVTSPQGRGHRTQTALDEAASAQEQENELALKSANANLDVAQRASEAWQNVQLRPLSEAIAEYSDKLADLKVSQDDVDRSTIQGVNQWIRYSQQINETAGRLATLTERQSKFAAESDRLEQQLAKSNFGTLDKPGQIGALNSELAQIQSKLKEVGIDAATPNDAFAAGANLVDEQRVSAQGLALAWANVTAQIGKTQDAINKETDDANKKSADWQRLHDDTVKQLEVQLAIDRARAAGNEDLAKKLERQRDLWRDITDYMTRGVGYDQALALATEKQNIAAASAARLQRERDVNERARQLGQSLEERRDERATARRDLRLHKTAETLLDDATDRRQRGAFTSEADRPTRAFGDRSSLTPGFNDLFTGDLRNATAASKTFTGAFAPAIAHALPSGSAASTPDGESAAAGKLDGAGDKLESAGEKLDQSGGTLNGAADTIMTAVDKLASAASALDGVGGDLTSVIQNLQSQIDNLG